MVIVQAAGIDEGEQGAVLSLLFAAGERPALDSLIALADRPPERMPFVLSHVPGGADNWVEMLAAGLAFDCTGLSPGEPAHPPQGGALLGLHEVPAGEAISLQPGPHLSEGRGMLPVIRILAGLGAELGAQPGLLAACWHPARCWMAAKYFRGVTADWLAGGAFPALGLTSLQRDRDGSMVSVGLDFMIGQELRFAPDRRLEPSAVARIAVRLIHSLIETGALAEPAEYVGPEGELLRIEPDRRGKELKVSVQRR